MCRNCRNWFKAGGVMQVRVENAEQIEELVSLDRKYWMAISCPVKGLRFDRRTLEFLDTDHDGRIRTPEVLAAIELLRSAGVPFSALFEKSEADVKRLSEVMASESDLAKLEPSETDKAAIAAWEAEGKKREVAILGDATAAAEAALAAVEATVDEYFTPPADMPLVTDEPDRKLPLKEHLNPKYVEAVHDFAAKCVTSVLGERDELTIVEWRRIKAAFAAYRAWKSSRPVVNAKVKETLEAEERVLRYKLYLAEFLENFVNMRHLYAKDGLSVFQVGVLRIDAKELSLCFHVESEAAHSALSGKSKCCVLYLKLSRPSEGATRSVCAVVTAGAVAGLYVGRNGVFYDRDGKDWEAVVTKVVENQVSLAEAFWAPWKKLGEGVAAMAKKFLGDKQSAASASVASGAKDAQAGGAAMASSVAAIGIGVGMVGAALASVMAVVSKMQPWQLVASLIAVILVVSLPSVVLTWFKLRERDLGAILNAGGWAVNRPMRMSTSLARTFTKCATSDAGAKLLLALLLVVLAVILYIEFAI